MQSIIKIFEFLSLILYLFYSSSSLAHYFPQSTSNYAQPKQLTFIGVNHLLATDGSSGARVPGGVTIRAKTFRILFRKSRHAELWTAILFAHSCGESHIIMCINYSLTKLTVAEMQLAVTRTGAHFSFCRQHDVKKYIF